MRRSFVLALVTTAFAAAFASEAAAEDIFGRVLGSRDPLTLERSPMAGQFLFLRRTVLTPDEEFQMATTSGPDGSYSFHGLVPGFTYKITRVTNDPFSDMKCPFVMMYIPFGAPAGFQGNPMPDGLLLPPGPPTNIDVDAPDGCSISSPCFNGTVAGNVVAVAAFLLDAPAVRWTTDQHYSRRHGGQVDGWETCFDPPYSLLPDGPEVTITWLESATPRAPFVGTFGKMDGAPLSPGDRVRVAIDPDQPALAGLGVFGPTQFEFLYDPDNGALIPNVEFHLQQIFELTGRAFVEHGTLNGVFDGTDLPLPGMTVEVFDDFLAPEPAPPVSRTTTDAEGRYRFIDLPQAFYRIVLRTPGPDADPDVVRLAQDTAPPPADFPFTEANCPHLPCTTGDVHEVAFDVRLFVGDVDPRAGLDIDFVELLDGCDRDSRLDCARGHWKRGPRAFGPCGCEPIEGASGVVTVEDVDVVDGWATIRIRLTADGGAFPARYFGGIVRRISVGANGRSGSVCTPFLCEALHPGTVLSGTAADDRCGDDRRSCTRRSPTRCASSERCDFTVVDLWGWRPWRTCVPAGRCPDHSTTLDGGVNAAEFEAVLRAPRSACGKKSRHNLDVSLECGGLLDAVHLAFDGDSIPSAVTGRRGVLVVTRAWRLADGTWRVRLRQSARDRCDGNPGTLPRCDLRLEVRLDDSSSRTSLNFGRIPFATGITTVDWLNAIDAGCRYFGR